MLQNLMQRKLFGSTNDKVPYLHESSAPLNLMRTQVLDL